MRLTNIAKFNETSFSKTDAFKNKLKETCQKKFHVDHYSKTEEFKQKCKSRWMRNFHTSHPMKSSIVKDKVKTTMNHRFNVDWFPQSPEFAKKSHMPYTNPKYPDMKFTTSWEFKVYDFLVENNIKFEYQPEIAIPYEYDGKIHYYHPDFRVGDRIVEVKGDNFFRINENTGKEEMYCTWRGDLSDEEYDWKCGKEEAKHQCMIANNVIIIRGKELSDLPSIFLK